MSRKKMKQISNKFNKRSMLLKKAMKKNRRHSLLIGMMIKYQILILNLSLYLFLARMKNSKRKNKFNIFLLLGSYIKTNKYEKSLRKMFKSQSQRRHLRYRRSPIFNKSKKEPDLL